jgi:hypothetical protein
MVQTGYSLVHPAGRRAVSWWFTDRLPWLVIAQDSSSCCHYGVEAFGCFAELLGIGSLDQLAHSLFAQRFTRLVAVQQVDHDLTKCQDSRKDHLGLRSLSGTLDSGQQRLRVRRTHPTKPPLTPFVCPRRAAGFSHCAYSASLSLVPSDRPRNCFGEPFFWVASIKYRLAPFSFRSGPARDRPGSPATALPRVAG